MTSFAKGSAGSSQFTPGMKRLAGGNWKRSSEAAKDKNMPMKLDLPEGQQLAQTLARRGDRHADRMMALLAVKIDDFENNPMRWLEPLMVYLAGEMRYEPAVPLIIGKLHEDSEVLGEECLDALVKIGTDSVICGVGEAFPSAPWSFLSLRIRRCRDECTRT